MTKRYIVQTMGCQMNVHDSRRIEEVLRASGWQATDEATLADLVIFNTCSIREKAEHKLMSALGTVRPLKDARKDVVIAVAGCVAQQVVADLGGGAGAELQRGGGVGEDGLSHGHTLGNTTWRGSQPCVARRAIRGAGVAEPFTAPAQTGAAAQGEPSQQGGTMSVQHTHDARSVRARERAS